MSLHLSKCHIVGELHVTAQITSCTRVPTSSGNHGKPGKSRKISSMHGNIVEFEKKLNNHGKFMEFCDINLKPPIARKLAVRHTIFVCLTASFLAHGGFKF